MGYPEEKHNGKHWVCRRDYKVMRVRKENQQQSKHEDRGRDDLPRPLFAAPTHRLVNSCLLAAMLAARRGACIDVVADYERASNYSRVVR